MGFGELILPAEQSRGRSGASVDLMHQHQCRVCTLNNAKLLHAKMPSTGSNQPLVYMLGEAPGKTEDEDGVQFVGESGQLLRTRLPKGWLNRVRWDNVIRCHPPNDRDPSPVETECCRPFIENDVAKYKPRAIFGFGAVPLQWLLKQEGIGKWRGRRVPVKVHEHACWYYPFVHPAYLIYRERQRRGPPPSDGFGTEDERIFALDLNRAFVEVEAGLPEPVVHNRAEAEKELYWVDSSGRDDLQTVLDFLEVASLETSSGLDIETNRLRPYQREAKILTIAISIPGVTMAFPWDHQQCQWTDLQKAELRQGLVRFLRSQTRKAVHHLAFELEWFGVMLGLDFVRSGQWDCTMSQAAVIDERVGEKPREETGHRSSGSSCFGLGFLTQLYFGANIKQYSNVNLDRLEDEPLSKVLRYNAMDAKYHRLLSETQRTILARDNLLAIYENLQLRRVPTVVLTQIKGVPLDQAVIEAFDTKYAAKIAQVESKLAADPDVAAFTKLTGEAYNPGSPKHAVIMLRDVLKSDAGVRRGSYSSDEAAFSKVKRPIADLQLEWRGLAKLHSTYIVPLKTGSPIVYPDGLLHPVLNTVFAETGRLSSEQPNEQNFPKRDSEGKEVRRQIVAPPGTIMVPIDYGQIEARVIAMASGDALFVKALWERYDIHGEWARRIALEFPHVVGGKKFINDKVALKKFRDKVKGGWVFALFFDAQLATACAQCEIPVNKESEKLYGDFWKQFAGVRTWQDKTKTFYRKYGYVECLTGRRRHGPLRDTQLVNAPIQGTACEIVMDSMNRLSELGDWHLQPFLNVHDDLTFILPENRYEEYVERAMRTMVQVPFSFVNVPITVEVSSGINWCDQERVMDFSSDQL